MIMKILGITDMQTSGAAILDDFTIIAAINEERLVRKKMARGFPRKSISKVLEISNVKPHEIEAVAISQINGFFSNTVLEWRGWFEERRRSHTIHALFFSIASKFGWLAKTLPFMKELFYLLRTPAYFYRKIMIRQILRNEFNINAPIYYYHHHFCHATAAYYCSGYLDALVVTMDGGGDKHSSHIYSVKQGVFTKLNEVDAYDSLGNFYAYVTALCGFKAKKHEGKITGLAAYGKPVYIDILKKLIIYDNGKTKNVGKVLFGSALKLLKRLLPEHFNKEDLASSIQLLCEDIVKKYVGYWVQKTDHHNVAMAGGVFANVRINEEVHNLPDVQSIFIFPGMSDEGLAVGAAYAYLTKKHPGRFKPNDICQISNVYFGPRFSNAEIKTALIQKGVMYSFQDEVEKKIAQLLAQGYVIAHFSGRMEYGPRALGNRSILYQPNDRSVNDWLNKKLKRTEFMPFAPALTDDAATKCFMNVEGALGTARFMTITFHCTEWMRKHCEGVVHLDNTARPQIVRKEDNPIFFKIIKEFEALTGVPVIINTSFNMHEEPIVCTPEDAINAFKIGNLDYLAIGNYLVRNTHSLNHALIPIP
jgi:carbamoyltransferase